jgi:hypothetical protein
MDGVVDAMLHFPGEFGLTNVTDPACPGCGMGFPAPDAADTLVPNPDEYLWWDFVHMSRVAHALIGEAAAEVVQAGHRMPPALSRTFESLAESAARSVPAGTDSLTLLSSLFARATQPWQTGDVRPSTLGNLDLRIADRDDARLGHLIRPDDNAAGWDLFVHKAPWDDSEFTTPGDQGEQRCMDLLTAPDHELGHVLGHDHDEGSVMSETLPAGVRRTPEAVALDQAFAAESPWADSAIAHDWVFALPHWKRHAGQT